MAELTGCEGVLALLKQIYEVLQEYDQQTDAMINAELEVLQQSLLARNALIEKLEELKQQLESVIEVEQPGKGASANAGSRKLRERSAGRPA